MLGMCIMKKENIVKESRDFSNTMNNGKKYWNEVLTIYTLENNLDKYRFGISVSKKIGNAVTRNRVKRQLKSILDKITFKNNFNCIIIVRKGILDKTFQQMQDELNELVELIKIKKQLRYFFS